MITGKEFRRDWPNSNPTSTWREAVDRSTRGSWGINVMASTTILPDPEFEGWESHLSLTGEKIDRYCHIHQSMEDCSTNKR